MLGHAAPGHRDGGLPIFLAHVRQSAKAYGFKADGSFMGNDRKGGGD